MHYVTDNVRFLILPQWHVPHLASRVLALNLRRLSPDWERYYGHRLLWPKPLWMRLVSGEPVIARPAGKRSRTTRGFAKRGQGYVAQGQPKQLWVRPLIPQARRSLLAPFLPPSHSQRKEKPLNVERISEGIALRKIHVQNWPLIHRLPN